MVQDSRISMPRRRSVGIFLHVARPHFFRPVAALRDQTASRRRHGRESQNPIIWSNKRLLPRRPWTGRKLMDSSGEAEPCRSVTRMTEQIKTKMQRIGTYLFAAMLLSQGILCFTVNLHEFTEHPTIFVPSGSGDFRQTLSWHSLKWILFGLALVALAIIAFIRTKRKDQIQLAASCSWPHWFLLIELWFVEDLLNIEDGFYVLRPFEQCICALFVVRWGIATIRKERNKLWIVYCALLVFLLFTMGNVGYHFWP